MADILFLLKPGFPDAKAGPGEFYCVPCATVSGLLSYAPHLREKLEVKEVAFPRPRAEVAALLGDNHPGCPVLVLDDATTLPDGIPIHTAPTGRKYVEGPTDIGNYLTRKYGVSAPHP